MKLSDGAERGQDRLHKMGRRVAVWSLGGGLAGTVVFILSLGVAGVLRACAFGIIGSVVGFGLGFYVEYRRLIEETQKEHQEWLSPPPAGESDEAEQR